MFDRLKNVMKGIVEKGISKAETPEVLAERVQSELESDAKKLKEALTASITNEKLIEQQLKKHQEEFVRYEKHAALALEKGDEGLAKTCLEQKRDHNQNIQSLTSQLDEQRKASVSLRQRSKEVEEKLQEFLRNKGTLLSRAQAGDALAKANELLGAAGSGNTMDKWEQKIREKELHGQALGEIDRPADVAELARKADESKLDDELAALKAQMAGAANPKLVVMEETAASNTKPAVDENVPMVVDVEEVDPKDGGKK